MRALTGVEEKERSNQIVVGWMSSERTVGFQACVLESLVKVEYSSE
jgi:hypothetical protein